MEINRRQFIKFTSLASASLLLPAFLKSSSAAFGKNHLNGKRLVVIQLSGGNDGLNCVVPYRNDLYYKARPQLGLKQDELIILNDEAGLNNNLQGLADLFHNGHLSIINNVGYPNPNRSHFRSTDIWQSASDEDKIVNTGWLGRYLDSTCNGTCNTPHSAIELDDTLSLALKGDLTNGLAFRNPESLNAHSRNNVIRGIADSYKEDHSHPEIEFLHKTLVETTQSSDYIYQHSKIFKSRKIYPNNDFGKRMKTIAELICSGSDTMIYYVSLSGFDTHAMQKWQHGNVLKTYSSALKTFCDDLKDSDRFDDTVILTFSEFGRRVKQNASKGTDHGAANNIYIAGGKLASPGIINDLPDLSDLDDGDLKYKVDFRQVYSSLLEKVFNTDAEKILMNKFEPVKII